MKINNYSLDPNAISRHKIINDIITKFQSDYTYLDKNSSPLNWIEKYFGLVRIEQQESKRFPVVMDGNEYKTVQPNDHYKSIAFFYDEGDGNFVSGGRRLEYTFNLIVWFNRDCITSTNYEIIDHLIRDAYTLLLKSNCTPLNVYIGRDDVFSQFNINEFDQRNMHAPFNAFRLRFNAIEVCDYRRSTGGKFQSNL